MKRSEYFISSNRNSRHKNDKMTNQKIQILIPILFEQEILQDTVNHFKPFSALDNVDIVFVTTEREFSKAIDKPSSIDLLRTLIKKTDIKNIHYPNTNGVKADQINYFIKNSHKDSNAEINYDFIENKNSYVLIYDADSRPDLESIAALRDCFYEFPNFNVAQQSSWFRSPFDSQNSFSFSALFLSASALRANRFVLAYELPRLIGRLNYFLGKRDFLSVLSNYSYSHVVGHGLCIRKSFLNEHPFPKNTILEDMHYGFMLNCIQEIVLPISILDKATVPPSFIETFKQSARWFFGPSRCFKYINQIKKNKSPYSWIIAFSAFLITIEWLLCFLMPFIIIFTFSLGSLVANFFVGLFCMLYSATFIYTIIICKRNNERIDYRALFLSPLVVFIFGVSGFYGLYQLLNKNKFQNNHKTMRC